MASLEIVQIPTVESKINFDKILEKLADDMRRYDGLKEQIVPLLDAKEVLDAQFSDLDLEIPAETYPEHVARNALEKLILDRRIKEQEKEISSLKWTWLDTQDLLLLQGYRNSKVEVEPLFPDEHPLTSLTDYGPNRLGTYIGSSKGSKKGKIKDISLAPDIGGILVFETRFSATYQAWGLIDRENDYQPSFAIRSLDKT
jgi:hypothetical protein